MSLVSVIIVSWNERALLERCLVALSADPVEIVVVDNASADGSAEMVARLFPAARLVRLDDNRGFAGAVNTGASASTGEHLLLLNSDTEAMPGAAVALSSFLDARADAWAAAGRLEDEAGRPQRGWNVRSLPTIGSLATNLLLIDRAWPGNPARRRYLALDVPDDRIVPVEQPAAACLMVRRSVFERLGGFDAAFYPAWFEDVDFCRRLWQRGGRIYYVPGAVFRHRGGVARDRLGRVAFAESWYRNLDRYVSKHYRLPARVLLRTLVAIGAILRTTAGAVRRDRLEVEAHARVLVGSLTGWRGYDRRVH